MLGQPEPRRAGGHQERDRDQQRVVGAAGEGGSDRYALPRTWLFMTLHKAATEHRASLLDIAPARTDSCVGVRVARLRNSSPTATMARLSWTPRTPTSY
jgi:hypothetical protein